MTSLSPNPSQKIVICKSKQTLAPSSYVVKSQSLSLFKHLVQNSFHDLFLKKYEIYSVYQQLLEEISKTQTIINKKTKITSEGYFHLEKILVLLQTFPHFKYFLSHNYISTRSIIRCLPHLKVFHLEKNHYVFHKGDPNSFFYIIIDGSVIIKELALQDEKYILRDKQILYSGECFGETSVIYNIPRVNTVITTEETTLLGIPRDVFSLYLKDHIIKAERERREKLFKLIPFLAEIPFRDFIVIYNSFVFTLVKKMDFIYKEGEKADAIYIITKGRAKLMKSHFNMISIGENCIGGLEAMDYVEKENEITYITSLLAIDTCFIIKIRIKELGKIYIQFKKNLSLIKKQQEELIQKLMQNNILEKKKFQLNYHHTLINNRIKNDFILYNQEHLTKAYNQLCQEKRDTMHKKKVFKRLNEKTKIKFELFNYSNNKRKPILKFDEKLRTVNSSKGFLTLKDYSKKYNIINYNMSDKAISTEKNGTVSCKNFFITKQRSFTFSDKENQEIHTNKNSLTKRTQKNRAIRIDNNINVSLNVKRWQNVLNINNQYNSGHFNFPLLSLPKKDSDFICYKKSI